MAYLLLYRNIFWTGVEMGLADPEIFDIMEGNIFSLSYKSSKIYFQSNKLTEYFQKSWSHFVIPDKNL